MIITIDILFALVMIIAGYIFTCFYLNGQKLSSKQFDVLKITNNKIVYAVIAVVLPSVMIVILQSIYHVTLIQSIKLLSLVLIMVPIAAIDYRLQKIPNQLILFALALRVLLYIPEFIISPNSAISVIKDNLIGAIVIGGFFLILLLVFKNSIGMGDVKLFAIMGLYQGLWGAVNSVFFSLIASFIVSVVLLATKKKKRKDTISFGPSIMMGTVIGICLAGM